MNATTVVFDLDGTLVDSSPDIAAALNRAFAPLGVRGLGDAEVLGMLGGGPRILVERAWDAVGAPHGEMSLSDALERYTVEYRADPVSRTSFFADAAEALPVLARRGASLGICTNKRTDIAERVLEHLGVRGLFDSVIGSDRASAPKPDARHLLDVLAELGAGPGESLYVGDTDIDAETSRAAGVPYVHVRWGHPLGDAFRAVDRFADLIPLVRDASG